MDKNRYLLLDGGVVITVDGQRRVYRDGAVLIRNNLIEKVGTNDEVHQYLREHPAEYERIDTKDSVVMPGLVNCHTHLFQSLYRGLGDNLSVTDWCINMIFPLSKYMGEEEAYISGLLAQMEFIRTGSTTFADSHYIHKDKRAMDGLAGSVKEMGTRGVLVRAVQNISFPGFPDDFLEDRKTIESELLRCIHTYNGTLNGRIRVVPEAITDQDVDPETLIMLHEIGKEYGVGLHMHTAESTNDINNAIGSRGNRSIEYLAECGVLDENTLLAHCVWVTPHELHLLASTGTKVAHNPVSNLMLGDGIAPVPYMREMGIDVGLGVDGAASNNSQDMFEAMKTCLLQHRGNWIDPNILNPEDVFEMATIGSAKALRMEKEIGSLEAGKKADVTIVGTNQVQMCPSVRPLSNLVLSANGLNVDTVIIDGEIVLRDKRFTKIDEERILSEANRVIRKMIEKAGCEGLITAGNFRYIG